MQTKENRDLVGVVARLADDGAEQQAAEQLVDEGVRRLLAVDSELAPQHRVDVELFLFRRADQEVLQDGQPPPRDLLGPDAVQQVAQ